MRGEPSSGKHSQRAPRGRARAGRERLPNGGAPRAAPSRVRAENCFQESRAGVACLPRLRRPGGQVVDRAGFPVKQVRAAGEVQPAPCPSGCPGGRDRCAAAVRFPRFAGKGRGSPRLRLRGPHGLGWDESAPPSWRGAALPNACERGPVPINLYS